METVNTVEAWLGSLPGHVHANVRRPLLHSLNLADLVPVLDANSRGWPAIPVPLFPPDSPPLMHAATTGATPFRLNLHVGDLGHTLVLGPTGAGKSTLLRHDGGAVPALSAGPGSRLRQGPFDAAPSRWPVAAPITS